MIWAATTNQGGTTYVRWEDDGSGLAVFDLAAQTGTDIVGWGAGDSVGDDQWMLAQGAIDSGDPLYYLVKLNADLTAVVAQYSASVGINDPTFIGSWAGTPLAVSAAHIFLFGWGSDTPELLVPNFALDGSHIPFYISTSVGYTIDNTDFYDSASMDPDDPTRAFFLCTHADSPVKNESIGYTTPRPGDPTLFDLPVLPFTAPDLDADYFLSVLALQGGDLIVTTADPGDATRIMRIQRDGTIVWSVLGADVGVVASSFFYGTALTGDGVSLWVGTTGSEGSIAQKLRLSNGALIDVLELFASGVPQVYELWSKSGGPPPSTSRNWIAVYG